MIDVIGCMKSEVKIGGGGMIGPAADVVVEDDEVLEAVITGYAVIEAVATDDFDGVKLPVKIFSSSDVRPDVPLVSRAKCSTVSMPSNSNGILDMIDVRAVMLTVAKVACTITSRVNVQMKSVDVFPCWVLPGIVKSQLPCLPTESPRRRSACVGCARFASWLRSAFASGLRHDDL